MPSAYYSVKKGRSTGVFNTWDECSQLVIGYPGAEYKKFKSKAEAEAYASISPNISPSIKKNTPNPSPSTGNSSHLSVDTKDRLSGIASSYYAVRHGRHKGVFTTWEECKQSVSSFPGAEFKKFKRKSEADDYVNSATPSKIAKSVRSSVSRNSVSGSQNLENLKEEFKLSNCQLNAIKYVLKGYDVFISGPAGVGKSFVVEVLQKCYAALCQSHSASENNDNDICPSIAFTASTGCAASCIRGETIHSWAGVGMGLTSELTPLELVAKMATPAKKRWRRTACLLIDEVSMLAAGDLDKLSEIACILRGKKEPFGGMQVVLVGDFFQLPPVKQATAYCFQSHVWSELFSQTSSSERRGVVVLLDQIVRQKDMHFCRMLNEVRWGRVSETTHTTLYEKCQQCMVGQSATTTTKSVKLFSLVRDVDRVNEENLLLLPGDVVSFLAEDSSHHLTGRLNSETKAAECLNLKRGAQVMLIQNLDPSQGLVNGTIGRVVRFENVLSEDGTELEKRPVVRFFVNRVSGTSHDEQRAMARGLSQRIPGHNKGYIRLCQLGYTPWTGLGKEEQGRSEPISLPLVNKVSMGLSVPTSDIIERTMDYECFHLHDAYQEVIGTRKQIPLILAYAMTIHKSQGMSIPDLDIDMRGIFTSGQAYVALSRAISFDSLRLHSYNVKLIRANSSVVQYYSALSKDISSKCDSNEFVSTSIHDLITSCRQENVDKYRDII